MTDSLTLVVIARGPLRVVRGTFLRFSFNNSTIKGAALGTSLSDALVTYGGDEEKAYQSILTCAASTSNTGEIWDDDNYYTPDYCCNGWFSEDDCTVSDFW